MIPNLTDSIMMKLYTGKDYSRFSSIFVCQKQGSFFYLVAFMLLIFSCQTKVELEKYQVLESLRINQLGFFPNQKKIAIWVSEEEEKEFWIVDTDNKDLILKGKTSLNPSSTFSGKKVQIIDFSSLNKAGKYEIIIPLIGKSYPFEIKKGIFENLGKASLKAFYYQRASTPIDSIYAGKWSRSSSHPDTNVSIHSSAADSYRPEGYKIDGSKGWYDAGDYNKYVVNSGITLGTLMSLYEDYPHYFQELTLNIPESQDRVPDILNEIQWNLDWMIGMQDPSDGGVYHKLTTAKFEGFVQPIDATHERFVVQKSTAAALDFAAVMAQAHRIFKTYSPQNSEWYLKAAEKAWHWAEKNPAAIYDQNSLNERFAPPVTTGAYGDKSLDDERVWAASELFIATHNLDYWKVVEGSNLDFILPTWSKVKWLGYYSLLRHSQNLSITSPIWIDHVKLQMQQAADEIVKESRKTAFLNPMETQRSNFVWGSNAVAANQGILLIQAFKLFGEPSYLEGAFDNLDYLLGRNSTGYSYATGFGAKTPQFPHHRLIAGRESLGPLPGYLVGGPNPGQQDKVIYSSSFPDESYVDDLESYASNEIAINWNAAFAYLVNALQAIEME